MRVKDVPVFYLPVLYYPIQSDDRATGFLLPTYGTSTFRGQSLSNAFFWAINRSQDLTLLHDWFTETGQGYGGEYRYVLGPGSEGNLRAYRLADSTKSSTARRSLRLPCDQLRAARRARTAAAVWLPRARAGRLLLEPEHDSSSITTTSTMPPKANGRFGGSVTGNWGGTTVTGKLPARRVLLDRRAQSTVGGYAPSLTANLSSKRLGTLPIYVASTRRGGKIPLYPATTASKQDLSLGRFDIQPSVRVALSATCHS